MLRLGSLTPFMPGAAVCGGGSAFDPADLEAFNERTARANRGTKPMSVYQHEKSSFYHLTSNTKVVVFMALREKLRLRRRKR